MRKKQKLNDGTYWDGSGFRDSLLTGNARHVTVIGRPSNDKDELAKALIALLAAVILAGVLI